MSTLPRDLRYSLRHLRHRPLAGAAILATLAVVVAAATVAFGVTSAVLWKPLPFAGEERLVFVWEEVERAGDRQASRVTGARYAAWRDAAPGHFDAIAIFGSAGFTMDTPDGAVPLRGVRVSASFFDTLGVEPAAGRMFTADDEVPGRDRVVILSSRFWQQRFGASRDAIGSTLRLSGQTYTVIGIAPPAVYPGWPTNPAVVGIDPEHQEIFVPIPRTTALDQSARAHVFGVVARLKPGVASGPAAEALTATAHAGAPDPHGARLTPLREQFVRDARTPLLALAGAALAIVLIACANLASLQVSTFESRRSEFAVRAAIGAGPARLVKQVVMESALLTAAGSIGGVALAFPALKAVPLLAPSALPLVTAPRIDLRVSLFAAALAFLATVLITAWPVRRLLAAAPAPRGIAEPARGSVHRVLVVAQIAVCVALVVVAALLTRSLEAVRGQDPGFTVQNVYVASLSFPQNGPPDARRIAAAEAAVLAAVSPVRGVVAAAAAYDHPLQANWSETPLVTGDTSAPEARRQAELRIVSPGYFEALGVDVLDGRALSERDTLDAPGAVVVNEAFAREVGGRAIGRRLQTGTPQFMYPNVAAREFEIVGVVRNERLRGLEAPPSPAFYLSTRQFPQTAVDLLVRTAADPVAVAGEIRAAVRQVDRGITLDRPTTLEEILGEQLATRRVTTGLIGALAGAALALAAIGMYGLLSILVAGRRREIGVRLALGAQPRDVAARVLHESLANSALGLVAGCALALAAGRLVESLLVGVRASDPATLLAVAATLLIVSVAAALGPALHAASTDPMIALRSE